MKQRPDFEKELLLQIMSCAVVPLFFFAAVSSLTAALSMFGRGKIMENALSMGQCMAAGAIFSGGTFLISVRLYEGRKSLRWFLNGWSRRKRETEKRWNGFRMITDSVFWLKCTVR